MTLEKAVADFRAYCVERLGPDVGPRVAALARPGFALTTAEPGEQTGGCRFGGPALLEEGTAWPMCQGFPMSLLAVLDTDALRPWLGDLLPPDTGLLNFFHLDADTERAHDEAMRISMRLSYEDTTGGAVVKAAASRAVEVPAPELATVFDAMPWTATPGLAFPDWGSDPALDGFDLGEHARYGWLPNVLEDLFPDWPKRPAALPDGTDLAFGRPEYPTGSPGFRPEGEDPESYHHLLQLSGKGDWYIGGDGGLLHYAIPSGALRTGDFTRAIPTPDIF